MRTIRTILLIAIAVGIASCAKQELEVRTFDLKYMPANEAADLIDPYVYGSRQEAPGTYSISGTRLTVRETAENLALIAQVLAEYDAARPSFTFHVMVIEANGGGAPDEDLAPIYDRLTELFRFQGYSVAGRAVIPASVNAPMSQNLGSGEQWYEFQGHVFRLDRDESGWKLQVHLRLDSRSEEELTTTAVLRVGQTTLVGSTQSGDGPKAIILAVRPEIDN
jgi:hypothetical protein